MGIKESFSTIAYDAALSNNGIASVDKQRLTLRKWRNGNENPLWKDTIAKGGNATTELHAYEETAVNNPGFWKGTEDVVKKYSSQRQGFNFAVNPREVGASTVAIAQAKATTKAYQIINRLSSSFSGQVFAGEAAEAKKLLINPLKGSMGLADSLVKARKMGKGVAQPWLEFQFGLKPLLSDVDAIIDNLSNQVNKSTNLAYRTYGMHQTSETSSVTEGFDIYGFQQTVRTIETLKAECIIRFAVTQKYLDNAGASKTSFADQFNQLSDVPMTAWELVPWSFLVDYFVNVSDIIQSATTATSGLTYISNSTVRTYTMNKLGSTNAVLAGRFKITENVPRMFEYKKRYVDRNGTPLGIPPVVVSLPGSDIRYLNIAALLASLKR